MRDERMPPDASNWISTHLPKRDELEFLTVLALPRASSRGFACRMHCSTKSAVPPVPPARPAAPHRATM